jgi:hypothetical protein
MFGVAGKVSVGSHALNVVVTQGLDDIGGGFFNHGYHSGNLTNVLPGFSPIGSISPNTYKGVSIESIAGFINPFGTDSFALYMAGNLPQGFFNTIFLPGFGLQTSASATHGYTASDDVTAWGWVNDPLASEWDGVGDLLVLIR